jgi:putative selenate reductase
MLRRLAKQVAAAGCTDLASYRDVRQAAAVADGHVSVSAQSVASLHGDGGDPYHLAANEKLPRSVENDLEMFGCVACNFCITVCPNDAFFSIKSLEGMSGRQQYLVLAELCNECGNCMVFCPEQGDPAAIKPRLYTDATVYAARDGQGFLLEDGTVTASRADDDAVSLVRRLLDSEQGLPLQPVHRS